MLVVADDEELAAELASDPRFAVVFRSRREAAKVLEPLVLKSGHADEVVVPVVRAMESEEKVGESPIPSSDS